MSPTTVSQSTGTKRPHQDDEPVPEEVPSDKVPQSATSAFRNVSACNRCRARKNRCDQQLPACSACEKANVRCVGYDPITKREIPRSYVYFLESRLSYFESLLVANDIQFDPPEAYEGDSREAPERTRSVGGAPVNAHRERTTSASTCVGKEQDSRAENEQLDNLVSNIGMVSVHGTSDHRYLGSTSGISFARVVLAAVKDSVSTTASEKAGIRPSKPLSNALSGGSSMRDSYFGLQTKPQMKEAPFPDKELAEKLVNLYFEYANPQIPTLHRVEFMEMFNNAYRASGHEPTSRELYFLNIVFAIGAGIIWGSSDAGKETSEHSAKRSRMSGQQAQPEEYHASAIVHLNAVLGSSGADTADRPGGELEELQAVLLLAGFALLRPVSPGLWYIVGVAVRLAIDLGLHYEDGAGIDTTESADARRGSVPRVVSATERGRREWMRDLRRRLWWCTYTFDRLVSTCVGRPFGITDQVVTTEFPSLLEDRYITKTGFTHVLANHEPTYKRVAYHYFRLRLLQSEILQVLQYQQAQQARLSGRHRGNEYMHANLPSPFLIQHASFRSWRQNMDQRLWEWKESAPRKEETGVAFSIQFLELNYWQAVIVLYRQSLAVPAPFVGEMSPTEDVSSPTSTMLEDKEDEDLVFLKCAEAGQKTLKLYRQLHRQRLINFTYLATHHLFMAGISFLYAVWHSPVVRGKLSLDDFDFTVLAATSVLGDLMQKCPPAEACRDAFQRMSTATVQMCMSRPEMGFGSIEGRGQGLDLTSDQTATVTSETRNHNAPTQPARGIRTRRPEPKFDLNLKDLFSDDVDMSTKPSSIFTLPSQGQSRQHSLYQRQGRSQRPLAPRPSVGLSESHMDTSPNMGQTELGHGLYPSPKQQLGTTSTQRGTMGLPYFQVDQNTYNPDFMSNNLPGMEFLSSLTGNDSGDQLLSSSGHRSQQQPQLVNSPSLDQGGTDLEGMWVDSEMPAQQNSGSEWDLNSGFGVGMGLDLNAQHDWSDGQNGFDLFNDFFFGSNDGGNNV